MNTFEQLFFQHYWTFYEFILILKLERWQTSDRPSVFHIPTDPNTMLSPLSSSTMLPLPLPSLPPSLPRRDSTCTSSIKIPYMDAKLFKDNRFWFASFLVAWAAALQVHFFFQKKMFSPAPSLPRCRECSFSVSFHLFYTVFSYYLYVSLRRIRSGG